MKQILSFCHLFLAHLIDEGLRSEPNPLWLASLRTSPQTSPHVRFLIIDDLSVAYSSHLLFCAKFS